MKNTNIKLSYISYYKLKHKKNNFYYFFYIFKKYNKLIFNFFNLPKKKKLFTLVKSPKCFKVGKLLVSYNYYNFFFNLVVKNDIIYYNNLIHYFYFLAEKYNIYQSIFYKNNSITIKINTIYTLRLYMISAILVFYLIYNLSLLPFVKGLVFIFMSFLFMFLQVLFFTTCERKILALTQRRLGPKVVGDMGRLQYFADAIKLIAKTYTSPRKINSLFFSGAAVSAFWFSWYNFSNLSFNYGEDIMEVEYNIFFFICCSLGFSVAWLVSGWASVSKYALLGCIRSALQIISYEILMSGVFLILFALTGTTNFEMFMDQQVNFSIFFFLPLVAIICFITTLMETNRPPFDLSEAESDVVAGYTVEYTGIMFGLFYLGEYVNLFTNSFILVILFSGGWWSVFDYLISLVNLLNTLFYNIHLNFSINSIYSLGVDLIPNHIKFIGVIESKYTDEYIFRAFYK